MRTTVISITIVLLSLLSDTSSAMLGETTDEAAKRYGILVEQKVDPKTKIETRKYIKSGIGVEASFFLNTSGKKVIGEVRFCKMDLKTYGGKPAMFLWESAKGYLSEDEVQQLLSANDDGQAWTQIRNKPLFRRKDAEAEYYSNEELRLTLDEFRDYKLRIEQQQKEMTGDKKKALKGF